MDLSKIQVECEGLLQNEVFMQKLRIVKSLLKLLKFFKKHAVIHSVKFLGVLNMYIMQTGCYFFTKEEVLRITNLIKEKISSIRLFGLTPCKSA